MKLYKGGFRRRMKTDRWVLGTVTLTDGKIFKLWTKFNETEIGRNLKTYATRWIASTQEFTVDSLVKFINYIQPGYAFTEEDFEKYRKKVRNEN